MGRTLITWWEALPGRSRVLIGIPVAALVLFLFHEAFFPLLSWKQSLMYAVMECVPVALVLAWATQNELRRRAERDDPAD
jgi:hypothetical protein